MKDSGLPGVDSRRGIYLHDTGPLFMPTIASFLGVSIRLYFKDHQPPHFHAFHGDDEAMIAITPVAVLAGSLTPVRLKDVLAWAQWHQQDLLDCWQRCQSRQPVPRIAHP